MLMKLTKSGEKMEVTPVAESLLNGMSSIAKIAGAMIAEKANSSEIMIFHMISMEECESGQGRIQLSEISRKLCISRPAVTQCVDRLEKKDMLERCSDPNDRRAVFVKLTDKGKEYFENIKNNAINFINRVIENMGEENARQLAEQLERLKAAITEETQLMNRS